MSKHLDVIEEPRRSVLLDMATKYGMQMEAFEATLRATVFPKDGTREQFAAFLLVAKEYNLNPLTKEIYAFPAKGGGIQPIVSIDGWANLINSHPAMDGLEFVDHLNGDRELTAITARIWRKDRTRPIVVTEYMDECRRGTDAWNTWPRRMLRHKAMIQCARYAFGFAGIVDPDEADRIGVDASQSRTMVMTKSPPSPHDHFRRIAKHESNHNQETGEINEGDVIQNSSGTIPTLTSEECTAKIGHQASERPTTPDEYSKTVKAYIRAADNSDALEARWREEKQLRARLGVSVDDAKALGEEVLAMAKKLRG